MPVFCYSQRNFELNVYCEIIFFLLGDKGVLLMGKYYSICSLKINPSTVRFVLKRPTIGFCSGL